MMHIYVIELIGYQKGRQIWVKSELKQTNKQKTFRSRDLKAAAPHSPP